MAGTLRELSPSKQDGSRRWEMRVYVGRDPNRTVRDESGKVVKQGPPVHRSKVFIGGKRAAGKALEKFVKKVRKSEAASVVGTTATLGSLFDKWLANLERIGKARSTLETYRIHVEKHIRPALGSRRLNKLTAQDIDAYLGTLADKGLAPRTIKLDHAVLSGALAQAVEWGWLKANPAKKAQLQAANTEAPSISVEQVVQLYQAALADEDPDMALAIVLGAITGCRRGELCGLRWDDLDWERSCLTVERAWVPGEGGQHLTTTKTGKGRKVFIGAAGVAQLDRYWELQQERTGTDPDGWLLSYDGGTTPMRAKSMTEYVGRLAKRLKIPADFHTLRHFAATELVAQGVDLPTAAGQLGHTTGVMAAVYLHATEDRGAAAGELIGGLVAKALSAGEGS